MRWDRDRLHLQGQVLVQSQRQGSSQHRQPAKQSLRRLSVKWVFMCTSTKSVKKRKRCLYRHLCSTSAPDSLCWRRKAGPQGRGAAPTLPPACVHVGKCKRSVPGELDLELGQESVNAIGMLCKLLNFASQKKKLKGIECMESKGWGCFRCSSSHSTAWFPPLLPPSPIREPRLLS